MIMQESGGDLHVRHGDGGRSHGVMQIATGLSCYGTAKGACTSAKIRSMIRDGIYGTPGSDGLLKCYQKFGSYAPALRCYNSGPTVVNVADLTIGFGTPSYVSDIGNRLLGVVDVVQGSCQL